MYSQSETSHADQPYSLLKPTEKLSLTDIQHNNGKQQEPGSISPDTQEVMDLLLTDLRTGKAQLNYDEKGNVKVDYPSEKRRVVWDASGSNMLAVPKTDQDMKDKVEASLELVNYLKTEVAPSGTVLDKTKVSLSGRKYREGLEFEKTKQVLGSGSCANDIVVVKDKKTGDTHALKTMMISCFNKNEIRCWVDMSQTGLVPSLYLFRIEDNKICMHMEILEKAITLNSIIEERMGDFYRTAEDMSLVKPFSLFVLDGALEAVSAMHDKNWLHNDLHGGNLMLQKNTEASPELEIKILDFGLAAPLETVYSGINFRSFQMDIAQILRIFTGLYTFQTFNNVFDIKQNWESKLQEVTEHFTREDREELFCLVDAALKIVSPSEVQGYRDKVKEKLKEAMGDQETQMEILKRVSLILFPEDFQDVHSGTTTKKIEADIDASDGEATQSNEVSWRKADSKSLPARFTDEADYEVDYPDVTDASGYHDNSHQKPAKYHSMDEIYDMAKQVPDDQIDRLRHGISIQK